MNVDKKRNMKADKKEATKTDFATKLKNFLILTGGSTMVAIGSHFFKNPNEFATGGVTGVGIILGKVIPPEVMNVNTITVILNIIILIFGLMFVGKSFTVKTIYCTLLFLAELYVLPFIINLPKGHPMTDQPVLELMFAIILQSAGCAVLLNAGGSTGGSEIIAMIIKKYKNFNIAKALFCTDIFIVLGSFITDLAIGTELKQSVTTFLFSFTGFACNSFLINLISERINNSKFCTIIISKEHEDDVINFIVEILHKTATVSEGYLGAYKHTPRVVIITVLKGPQAKMIKKYLKQLDKESFMITCNTHEIDGKGFKETM